jgi:hypothetical protein
MLSDECHIRAFFPECCYAECCGALCEYQTRLKRYVKDFCVQSVGNRKKSFLTLPPGLLSLVKCFWVRPGAYLEGIT